MAKSTDEGEEGEFVRALARGLAVIESFEGSRRFVSLAEVARRTGLARGSARRLLLTLQRLRYVAQEDGLFCLTSKTLNLGHAYLTSSPLSLVAEETLRELSEKLRKSCSLAEMEGDEIVYVSRVSSQIMIRDYIEVGRRMPAYPTSLGRILLAEYDEVTIDEYLSRAVLTKITPLTTTDRAELRRIIQQSKVLGYAVSNEEIEIGRRSIAVPIRSKDGRAVAAINVSSAASATTCEQLVDEALPSLREASEKLGRVLSYTGDRFR